MFEEEIGTFDVVKTVSQQQEHKVGKAGRKPLHVLFPTLVEVATELLRKNGIATEKRRRDDVAFCKETTLEQLRQHLLKHVPG